MKKMTCMQLGGACEEVFVAETFDEIAKLSREHGMKVINASDEAHPEAAQKMRSLMSDGNTMQVWMDEKKAEFESAPDI